RPGACPEESCRSRCLLRSARAHAPNAFLLWVACRLSPDIREIDRCDSHYSGRFTALWYRKLAAVKAYAAASLRWARVERGPVSRVPARPMLPPRPPPYIFSPQRYVPSRFPWVLRCKVAYFKTLLLIARLTTS